MSSAREQSVESAGPARGATVLVVDDEPGIRALLELELSMLGHFVVVCASGAEALALLAHQEFDLVITDMKMPGATGLQVLRAVKARTPATAVIVVTGFTEVDEIEASRDVGIFELVHKPFELDALHAAVERALIPFRSAGRGASS